MTSKSSRTTWFVCVGFAAVYVLLAVAAALWLSPRVPYADTWRFDTQLLTHPFPFNLLMVDNGHVQILPRLLRWMELSRWHGNQWPTIATGIALLLLSLKLWAGAFAPSHNDGEQTGQPRLGAAWLLIGAMGLCWLGNGRTLAHGNEAIHSYLIIACLFAATRLATQPGQLRLAIALLLAIIATLSFGTGAAVFAAIMVVLFLRRAHWRAFFAVELVALAAGVIYLLLPSDNGSTEVFTFSPITQFSQGLRWLAAPWLLAGGPLVDAELLPHLPAPLRALAAPFAHLSTALFGPASTATWPQLGFGVLGIAWLVWLSVQCRRQPSRQRQAETLALACSWFALACAAIVVLARTDYFLGNPEQIYAPRYAVWYSLFWCGLLGATLCRLQAGGRARTASRLVILTAVLLLPSTSWMGMRTAHMSRVATSDAAALRVGVIDRYAEHGENQVEEMLAARSVLLQARTAIFAPAAGPLIGTVIEPAAASITIRKFQRTRVENLLDDTATQVSFAASAGGARRLLLLDGSWQIIGEARPAARRDQWQGWVTSDDEPVRAVNPEAAKPALQGTSAAQAAD